MNKRSTVPWNSIEAGAWSYGMDYKEYVRHCGKRGVPHRSEAEYKALCTKFTKASKPATDAQKLSQLENYGLFVIKGMLGNLWHIKKVPSVRTYRIGIIEHSLKLLEADIKYIQHLRKIHKEKTINARRTKNGDSKE